MATSGRRATAPSYLAVDDRGILFRKPFREKDLRIRVFFHVYSIDFFLGRVVSVASMSIPPGQRSFFPQIDLVNPGEVRACLGDDHALLWRVATEPFNDLMHRRATDTSFHGWDEYDIAQWLHIQMKLYARRVFETHPRIHPARLKSGMFVLNLEGEFTITIKKLRIPRVGPDAGELSRSNYPTQANLDYWEQREREDFPENSRVILGYLLEHEATAIRVMIGYSRSRGKRLLWHYPIDESPQTGLWAAPADSPEDHPTPGFEIVPDLDADKASDDA
jgi:hypothetical protein